MILAPFFIVIIALFLIIMPIGMALAIIGVVFFWFPLNVVRAWRGRHG